MNAKPHTHQVGIEERPYSYRIVYGDQTEHVGKRFASAEVCWRQRNTKTLERMIQRRIKRMIRRHDRESMKAGQRTVSLGDLAGNFNSHLLTHNEHGRGTVKEAWGADLLREMVS